jgi:carboxyl-terminal processing protease
MKKIFTNEKQKFWVKIVSFTLLCAVLLYFVFSFGYTTGQRGKSIPALGLNSTVTVINKETGKPSTVDFSLFWEAWNKLQDKSVLNPEPQKMLDGAISGMLGSIGDPYTVYFTPEDNKRFQEDIQGEFDGIGVELIVKNGLPTVVAPLSQTPAEKAGMKAGDVIMEVDGAKTADLGFNAIIDKIRGKKGTKVTLKIAREGKDEPITMEVERDTIIVKSVTWETKEVGGKKIGYVKVRQFGDDTDTLFNQFIDEMLATKVDGIVVDLRNDPGGYLDTAVSLSSYFLDGGVVVSEEGKGNAVHDYNVTRKARLKGIRTAVLVNKGSASASEIFAGALQDTKTGEIIGDQSFGKGSVQELIQLSNGSSVKITVAKWLTPKGRAINGEGITPDIVIANGDDVANDLQLNRALDYIVKGE